MLFTHCESVYVLNFNAQNTKGKKKVTNNQKNNSSRHRGMKNMHWILCVVVMVPFKSLRWHIIFSMCFPQCTQVLIWKLKRSIKLVNTNSVIKNYKFTKTN